MCESDTLKSTLIRPTVMTSVDERTTLELMRVAAIDVGTNSVHMVIADVGRSGHFDVIDRVKETIRLGRRSFETGRLGEEAMELAVRTLANFRRVIELRKVDRLRAVATSAVREASNRDVFIRRIRRETGIKAEVIAGAEEARLIFVAARHAMGLEGGPHLIIDIGGGSLELILVRDAEPLWMRSLPFGASRLTEHFFRHDPPAAREVKELESHLRDAMGEMLRSARRAEVQQAIGTSRSVNTLVAMARAGRGEDLGRLHGAGASAGEVARLRGLLIERDYAERMELEGIDSKRADLMPAASIVVNFVLKHCGAPKLVACTWALREGLLLELAGIANRRAVIDARRHSVAALAQKFEGDNLHGKTVAHLAGQLFDATATALGLRWSSRELLEHAALLHDIGHTIDHDRHNRHSYYLISNADLFGFSPLEVEMIAQIARGHRKRGAKFDSSEMRALPEEKRRIVRALAAILRVADALDRSHFGVIKNVQPRMEPGRLLIYSDSGAESAELELWTCERRTDLLAKLLGRRVILRHQTPSLSLRRRRPVRLSRTRPGQRRAL